MNDDPEVFVNAPIHEAVVDFKVDRTPGTGLEVMAGVLDALRVDYPTIERRLEFRGRLRMDSEGKPQTDEVSTVQIGWMLRSADEKWVLLPRLDGFSASRLPQYTRWDDLLGRFRSGWAKYVEFSNPARVSRIATRYINRIRIPHGAIQWSEWFNLGIRLPGGIDARTGPGSIQTTLSTPDGVEATVTMVTEPPDPAGSTGVIFDIDVSKLVDAHPADPQLWSTLSNLRRLKNTIFLTSVTERTKELFR